MEGPTVNDRKRDENKSKKGRIREAESRRDVLRRKRVVNGSGKMAVWDGKRIWRLQNIMQ